MSQQQNNAAAVAEAVPNGTVPHAAVIGEKTPSRTLASIEAALTAKLKPDGIKQRTKGGVELDYVQAWYCIAEANRIFGHDGWSRKTIYCKEVCRYERKGNSKQLWVVGYEAKVEVTALGITREGTGHGSGQFTDLYDAIESAAKEAESDAMKRALMTYGNPFGLALYDKLKENVEGKPAFSNASLRNTFCDNVIKAFSGATTESELNELVKLYKPKFEEMDAGSEHDQLGVGELRTRYAAAVARIKEESEAIAFRANAMAEQLTPRQ